MGDKLTDFGPIGQYIPLFILGVIAIVLGLLLANLSKLMGPFRPEQGQRVCLRIWEWILVGTAHDRFSVKFYMVAMLFILFDIEVVFMYPWAVNFTQLAAMDKLQGGSGIFPLLEMFAFVVILLLAISTSGKMSSDGLRSSSRFRGLGTRVDRISGLASRKKSVNCCAKSMKRFSRNNCTVVLVLCTLF